MICIRLAGGLGNQLFQFAAAIALRGTLDSNLYLGTQSLGRYKVKRGFDLERIVDFPAWCLTNVHPPTYARIADCLMAVRIGRFLPFIGVNDRNFGQMLNTGAQSSYVQLLWLDGYFQQGWIWPFFETSLAKINAMLCDDFNSPVENGFDCLIHIRGSDFLANTVHSVADISYYMRAINALQANSRKIKSVLVITDDRNYAEKILEHLTAAYPSIQFEFSSDSHPDWLQDFMRLRSAKSRIIGNSSFSWWAAALDSNRAITVTPSQWMVGVPRDLFLPWEISLSVDGV